MYKIYKNLGETPLEALERLRFDLGLSAETPMTYAGRLDPLAEGLLIILIGDECKDATKNKYLGLYKVYESEIVLGLNTDTYDVMGLPRFAFGNTFSNGQIFLNEDQIVSELQKHVGKFDQEYPPYSSKNVGGRPLFDLARSGELEGVDQKDWPKKEVEIYNIELLSKNKISAVSLLEQINFKIGMVKGDFRHEQILKSWEQLLAGNNEEFLIIKIRASVSSGVYIRSLANSLGGVALSIKRVKVGEFSI